MSFNADEKAQELAGVVAASSKLELSSTDEDDFKFIFEQIILKACRKSLIDGFPLQDYSLGEIPSGDKTGVLAYFENTEEYGMGENYNPNAHEIIFWCPYDSKIAVPYALCNDGIGDYIEERPNCFEAVYRIDYPQKGKHHKSDGL